MKKTTLKKIAVAAIAILTLFGAASCKKNSNSSTSINTFNIRLGWGNNPATNQCMSLLTGTTYSLADGASNSESVDLIGFHYYSTGPCWFAPSSCDATTGWSRRKGTKIAYSNVVRCTPSVFASINSASELLTYTTYIDDVAGRTQSVEEGLVYPIKTYEGKEGLIRVVKIAGIDSDVQAYMDLEIKMER